MRFLLVPFLALASCSQFESMPTPPPVPEYKIAHCRPGMAQSPAPPLPRTLDTVIAAYNKAKEAGLATEAALRECSAKVDLLLRRD